jgi:membrane protein implicated in regulation of membrane protease activity
VFGEIAAHLIPQEESSAVSVEDLVGLFGTVVYPVSDTEGRIHVFDAFRTLHVEPAHVAPGAASIAKGTSVKVTAISPDGDYLIVTPADDAP